MNKKTYIPIAVFSFLVLAQLTVTIFKIDMWPFSSYTMFSQKKTVDKIGAFRMRAVKKDGTNFYMTLPGNKNNWMIYHKNVEAKNFHAIEEQMKRDFNNFIETHPEVAVTEIAQITLLATRAEKKDNEDLDYIDKELHSLRL